MAVTAAQGIFVTTVAVAVLVVTVAALAALLVFRVNNPPADMFHIASPAPHPYCLFGGMLPTTNRHAQEHAGEN